MTHYMELLATNQPWNLLLFMAVPVILAETVAVSELYILFTRNMQGTIAKINRWAGTAGGVYFFGVFIYLIRNAVIPLTQTGSWRGGADVIAVGAYLLGVIPLGAIALLDLGILAKGKSAEEKLKLHALFVGIFLVTAHIAMIFGMINPEVFGYTQAHEMSM